MIFLVEFLVDYFLHGDASILSALITTVWIKTTIVVLTSILLITVFLWMCMKKPPRFFRKSDAS